MNQHDQIYGNGGIGRRGNGLGTVLAIGDDDDPVRRRRPAFRPSSVEWEDPTTETSIESEEVGIADILLALECLTERQRFVIECRYGLRPGMDGERLAQHEIASLMGITQQGVLKIEAQGLTALKKRLSKSPIAPRG